ncbi:MATH domain and coiled-coil domain-containing protein At3g44800-like [Punica granatum]|nr:MATH domain and coiled-coil domain-containing protein At3g44800-like [Punica granatum]
MPFAKAFWEKVSFLIAKRRTVTPGVPEEAFISARMDTRSPSSGSYTWRINYFSLMTQKKYYSDVFTVGGCRWRILIFPKGNNSDYFAIYLDVPDSATLPSGWAREVFMTFTMVNQHDQSRSTKKDTRHRFNAREVDWGFALYKPLTELRDRTKGFLINDAVIVKAEVEVQAVVPPIPVPPVAVPPTAVPPTDFPEAGSSPPNVVPPAVTARLITDANRFDSFFSELEELIVSAETSANKEGPGSSRSNDQMFDLISGSPNLEEVEEAKQSLKECLSDLFKLNMKDKLAAALQTLTRAEVGLTSDQQKVVKGFWDNFNEFISDFLSFEQENSEFELQKLARDQMFSAIKRNREIHLSNKQLLESLNKEEDGLKRRMEELKSMRQKLMSDWERLMTMSEETKSKYTAQEKKLAEAEEKKRIAEETMSRSAAAWSSLKAQFL